MEYKEVSSTIDVPTGVGVEGFLRTIRAVLKLPLVQEVTLNAKGKVSYRRFAREEETEPLGVDYADLDPLEIVRRGDLLEMPRVKAGAVHSLMSLYDRLEMERLVPTCWVMSPSTSFWLWYLGQRSAKREQLYGLPVHAGKDMRDSVVILCGAFEKNAALIDCHRFLTLDVEELGGVNTTVDVL